MSSENSTQETVQTSTQDSGHTSESSDTTSNHSQTDSVEKVASSDSSGKMQQTTDGAPAAPVFTPNFKFKAFDKEYEIEEGLRPLITDSDKEKAIRKLHEKAYALDPMKENLNKVRTEFDGYKQSIEPKIKNFDFLNKIVQNKDWDTFFTKVGVPEQEIFDWVSKRIDLMQAGPQQQAEYQRQMAIREQSYMQESQLAQYQNMYQQQAVQTRTMQLDSLLNRPDVSKYASSWDEKTGSVGAFRQLVIDEAANNFHQTGRDMSTEEAINHVINRFGKVISVNTAPEIQAQPGSPQAPKQVPIIPAIGGKGTSPVKKVPRSLDDLKAMAKDL